LSTNDIDARTDIDCSGENFARWIRVRAFEAIPDHL
jgi:hypothetical protein